MHSGCRNNYTDSPCNGIDLITNNNMKYLINVTIYNTYEIESSSIEEAKEQLTNMSNEDILNDCDFNIIDVEEA